MVAITKAVQIKTRKENDIIIITTTELTSE